MESPDDIKMLLVEDNKINQRLFNLTIAQSGYKCDIANNGVEAFEMFRQNGYELIFMDIQMPCCDGIEATQMIRKYESDSKITNRAFIVALSASLIVDGKDECIEAGMDEYMEKPVKSKVLLALIDRIKSRNFRTIS